MTETRMPEELVLRGIGVSPGVAWGEAFVLESADRRNPRYLISPEQAAGEVNRLQEAFKETEAEIKGMREGLAGELGEEPLYILDAHLMILSDEIFIGEALECIRTNYWNAEWALENTLEGYEARFTELTNEYIRERRGDVRQVIQHVLRRLMGVNPQLSAYLGPPDILVARDLAVADLLGMDRKRLRGLVLELGGRTSHAAIIAGTLGIPAIMGVDGATSSIRQGDSVAMEGGTGALHIHPGRETLRNFNALKNSHEDRQQALLYFRDLPCETTDGSRMVLRANISSPTELEAIRANGATGVGLYRTECLYLNRADLPTEEEHLEVYRQIIEGVAPQPAVFRTFDLGGDVAADTLTPAIEANPALGLRAIRLSLAREDVLRPQLRSLLRASLQGRVHILHPFVSGLEEVRHANDLLRACARDLQSEGLAIGNLPPVGILVETPAAALMSDVLAKEVSFFTIGTNDLTQYTLAADRGNERISYIYDALHPAVLRLIRRVVQSADESGIMVAVCGEMAGDSTSAVLLAGMGVRELSMSPQRIPRIKEALRSISLAKAKAWADEVMSLPSTEAVRAWAAKHIRIEESIPPARGVSVMMGQAG